MAITKISAESRWKIISSSFILGPNAVVRELIDNSIDGGAKNIYIDIDSKTVGCEYICVRDDGSGIDYEDRPQMCLNHSTSKIKTMSDLSTLTALGFRGEALFLIASLSTEKGSMEVATKTQNDKIGERWYVNKDGSIQNNKRMKSSCNVGTIVTVRKLLGGLRARYLETSSKARKNIEELKYLLNHYSLNRRSIRFYFSLVSLDKNGTVTNKQVQQSLDTKLTKIRALSSLLRLRKPIDMNFKMNENLKINDNVSLEVILPTMHIESDIVNVKKPLRFLSLNNRAMSLQLGLGHSINKLINSVYRSFKMLDPIAWYININCDGKLADINIEPEKNDVLIKDLDLLLEEIKSTLTDYVVAACGISDDRSFNKTKSGSQFNYNENHELLHSRLEEAYTCLLYTSRCV